MPTTPDITVRKAVFSDLDMVITLDRAAGGAAHWDESRYLQALDEPSARRSLLVAESKTEPQDIRGFVVTHVVAGDWEIENMVVDAGYRRAGIACRLLRWVIEMARAEKAARIMLEVRASNAAAIALYEKAGFRQDGLRRDYYSNPPEDAILFSLSLKNSI